MTRTEELILMAEALSARSLCTKMRFGAVIADRNGRVLGKSWNHPICPEKCCIREGVPSGTRAELCYAIHAEQMALLEAMRAVTAGGGGMTCYVAGFHGDGRPWKSDGFYCTVCARLLWGSGIIERVIVPTDNEAGYTELSIPEILESSFAVATGERQA